MSKPPEARRKPKGVDQGTHLDKRAQGIPELRSQVILEPFKGIWSPCQAKADIESAGEERLSNQAEPLKWLYLFYKTVILKLLCVTGATPASASYSHP